MSFKRDHVTLDLVVLHDEMDYSSNFNCVNSKKTNLLSLPTELLQMIFKLLGTRDLINLIRCHPRLRELCCDRLFWENIVDPPDRYEILYEIVNKYVHEGTKTFQICASSNCHGSNSRFTSSFPPSLFLSLSKAASNLSKLFLIKQRIDGNLFRLTDLPKTLKVLHLTNSFVDVTKFVAIPNDEQPYDIEASFSYFKGIEVHLVNLEDLDLSFCFWIVALDLIHIRKLTNLERLSIKGCRFHKTIKSAFADSASVRRVQWRRVFSCIAQSGFDNLKVFDLNNTDISRNQLLQSYFRNRRNVKLEEFYLGYYDYEYIRSFMDYQLDTFPLQRGTNLKILDISGFILPESFSQDLRFCPLLQKLYMNFGIAKPEVVNSIKQSIPEIYGAPVRQVYIQLDHNRR